MQEFAHCLSVRPLYFVGLRRTTLLRLLLTILTAVVLAVSTGCSINPEQRRVAPDQDLAVSTFRTVMFEYVLSRDDGNVLESTIGGAPYVYVHGGGQILSALEHALDGMHINERTQVNLDAREVYGVVKPRTFREIPIDQVPAESRQVGAQVTIGRDDRTAFVHEVRSSSIIVSFDELLAGQMLTFDIRVVAIQ